MSFDMRCKHSILRTSYNSVTNADVRTGKKNYCLRRCCVQNIEVLWFCRPDSAPLIHSFMHCFIMLKTAHKANTLHKDTLLSTKYSSNKIIKIWYAHHQERPSVVSKPNEANESQIFSRTVRGEILNEVIS